MLPQPQSEDWFGLCPLSLAATYGIDVSFFSSRYLDVSVPWVRSVPPMNSVAGDWVLPRTSFLIQKSPDQRLFASFPEHIAGYHVFRRLLMPRHPPCTLSSLTTFIDHRRVPRTSLTGTSEPAGRAVTVADLCQTSHRPDAIANGSDRQKGARRLSRPTERPNGR